MGGNKIQCLVIGANGLLGAALGRLLSEKNISWTGTYNKRPKDGLLRLDITDPESVKELFFKIEPNVVFDCANLAGGVDFCESHPDIAKIFHLDSTINIGAQCKAMGAKMVFVSTDYVFDGTRGPYKEDVAPNPLNLYGKLKLSAEDWLQKNLKDAIVARTTNVYGWDPDTVTPNYMMSLFRAAKHGKPFNAPSFLWGNPTYAGDLAAALLELYLSGAAGLFHVVGDSFVNRHEWATAACGVFGLDGSKVREIKDAPSAMVPRPLKSWLNNEKFKRSYKTVLHDMRSGLELMNKDMPSYV